MQIDPFDVGLIPPLLSVYVCVCVCLLSLIRGRHNPGTLFFTCICLIMTLRPAQYLLQRLVFPIGFSINLEPEILCAYAFLPLVVIFFFHRTLRVCRPLLETLVLVICACMAIASYGEWFIAGTGSYLPFLILHGIFSASYIIYCGFITTRICGDAALRLKHRYIFISLMLGVLLPVVTGGSLGSRSLYPSANFMFIPMGIMAYGVLQYRVLDMGALLRLIGYRLVYGTVIVVINFWIFMAIRPILLDAPFYWLAPCVVGWYMANYLYVIRVHPRLDRRFYRYEHYLKTIGEKFVRDLLILRDTRRLVDEFGGLVKSTLLFDSSRFFFAPAEVSSHLVDMNGEVIAFTEGTTKWLVEADCFIDRYLLNSYGRCPNEGICRDFISFLDVYDGTCGVPLVQHDQLIGLVIFGAKQGRALVTPKEIQFLEKVSRYLSIALYNSRVYQVVTSLKDELELRRRELSREIIERHKAGESLRESELRYRILADNILDTFVVVDVADGTLQYASPSCFKLTGYSVDELMGRRFWDFLTESSVRELTQLLPSPREGAAFMAEIEHTRKDGQLAWIEVSGHFITTGEGGMEVVGLARDISERREGEMEKEMLYQKLRQAQKMESIGVLAGGIAHDFNNILMAILGYTQLGAMYLGEGETEAAGVVAKIEKAGVRAKELVSQILAFSRQNEQVRHTIDCVDITREALALIQPTLLSGVKIHSDFPKGPVWVMADPVQIHQIVVNLCTNASHALEESGGGIEVSIYQTTMDAAEARRHGLEPGRFLALKVSDTGQGMDDEVQSQIFDPYFTTKRAGKGVGMGLAVVHGIILSHNGAVVVESSRERGSTFHVYLPEVDEVCEILDVGDDGGQECVGRVLFVDDETMLVDLAREALTRMGFDVVAMDDPEAALERLGEDPFAFDVVVTDMTMPQISGLKLAEGIFALNSKIPVILCTGFSKDLEETCHGAVGISQVLFKPVPMGDLATAIDEVRRGMDPDNSLSLPLGP